jgi:Domain of unknown function (DUF5666)
MRSKRIASMLLAGAAAILALTLVGSVAAKSGTGTRGFHGTVAKVAKNDRAVTINRKQGSPVRFVVRAVTRYQHISGLSDLSKGDRVEVKAFHSEDRWVATKVEANPGSSGSSDDPAGDDHGSEGHGADDPPGDDHGSGGHGADDPPGDDHGSGGHGADDPPGDDHGSGGHGADG